MGNLSNLYISESFKSLAHLGTNTALVPGTMTELQDGIGQSLNIYFDGTNISSSGNIYAANLTGSGATTNITSLNAFTASQLTINTGYNTFTQSANSRLTNLEATTSSLNSAITQLNANTASQQISINNLNSFTASQQLLNGTFATTGSNTFVGQQTIKNNLVIEDPSNPLIYTQIDQNSVNGLFQFYQNGGNGYQFNGNVQVNELTASLTEGYVWVGDASGITTTVATSSFGTIINTGSFATTGSNSFNGNQTITGSFIVDYSGGNPELVIDSNTNEVTLRKTAGVNPLLIESTVGGVNINSNETYIGDSANTLYPSTSGNQNQLKSTQINGNLNVTSTLTASLQQGYVWVGDSTNTSVLVATSSFGNTTDLTSLNQFTASQDTKNATLASVTASLNANTASQQSQINALIAATASYSTSSTDISSLNAFTASQNTKNTTLAGVTASLQQFTQSQANLNSTFATTGSNTFNGDQIINGNITAVSGTFQYIHTIFETASVIYSSGSNQLGDELTDIQTLSGSVKVQGSLTINGTPVQTSSVDISSLNAFTASQDTKNSTLASYTASVNISLNNINQFTQSLVGTNVWTASIDTKFATLGTQSGSWITESETGSFATTSSFNAYTASNDSKVNQLINATASYAISSSVAAVDYAQQQQINSLIAVTASFLTSSTDISQLNAFTASQQLFNNSATASIVQLLNLSSSLSGGYVTEGELQAVTASLINQINTKLDTSSFNAYTQSTDSRLTNIEAFTSSANTQLTNLASSQSIDNQKWNNIGAQSGSWVTESETGSFARYDISNPWSADQTFTNISAVSASFQYVQTIFETASVIYSSGSNQFGDAANDVQTLYGSTRIVNELTASGLRYPTTDGIYSGQVLQTDAAGTLSFGNVVGMYQTVRNGEATSLTVGTAVYVSGSQGANPIVYRADSSNASKMPVQYIISETITSGQNGRALLLGVLEGYNVGAAEAGTLFYVDGNGTLTTTRPTGSTDIVQPIAIVTKTGPGGQLSVLNPGPVLLPNIQTGYVWVGNGNNQPLAVATSSFIDAVPLTSLNAFTQSQNTKNTTLENVTSSLQSYTASQNTINTNVGLSSSLYETKFATIGSQSGSWITESETGSFATTGSNTFTGQQTIYANNAITISGSNGFGYGITLQGAQGINLEGSGGPRIQFPNKTWMNGNQNENFEFTGDTDNTLTRGIQFRLYGTGSRALSFLNESGPSATMQFTNTSGSITIKSGTTTDISASSLTMQGFTFPTTDGTNGQVLTTNGFKTLSFTSVSVNTGSFATTGSNTFVGTQTINYSGTGQNLATSIIGNSTQVETDMYVDGGNYDTFNISVSASNGVQLRDYYNTGGVLKPFISVATDAGELTLHRDTNISGNLDIQSTLTASLQQGYVWVGNASGNTTTVATSSFIDAIPLTSLNAFTASQNTKNTTLATYTASVDAKFATIGGLTGSYATTGSNTFRGNQVISGSLIQSSSNSLMIDPIGGGVGTWIPNRVLIGGVPGQAPRLFISGSDGAFTEFGRGFINQDTRKTPGLGASIFTYGPTNSNGINIVAVANDDYSVDVELQMFANSSSVGLADWDNASAFNYIPFMELAPNNGDNPPVEFKRDVQVTGSVSITEIIKLKGQDPLPTGNIGDLAVSGSHLYFYNGTWTRLD